MRDDRDGEEVQYQAHAKHLPQSVQNCLSKRWVGNCHRDLLHPLLVGSKLTVGNVRRSGMPISSYEIIAQTFYASRDSGSFTAGVYGRMEVKPGTAFEKLGLSDHLPQSADDPVFDASERHVRG